MLNRRERKKLGSVLDVKLILNIDEDKRRKNIFPEKNNDISKKKFFLIFTVTSISVIDTQSTSFSSQNETSFPSSSSSSTSSTNSLSANATSSNTTSSSANRVNQQLQQQKSTATSNVVNSSISSNNNNNLLNDWHDVIRLPNSAIRQLKTSPSKEEQRSFAKIVVYAYKNLHQLLSDADQQRVGVDALEGESLVVNSRVISASIDGTLSSAGEARISDPVIVRFQHLQKTNAAIDDVVCVYWDLVRKLIIININ